MRTNRGKDKGQQDGDGRRKEAMIGRTEQKELAGSSYAGQFTAKLPMSHPFGEKQGQTTHENEDQIQGGRMSDPID